MKVKSFINELNKLHREALSWGEISNLINEEGYVDKKYSNWVKRVLTCLRKSPNAKEYVTHFLRLSRHHQYIINEWNAETLSLSSHSVIKESIEYIKQLLSSCKKSK